jgi:hypothetical protein
MAEHGYVAYVQQQKTSTDNDGNVKVEKTFKVGDDISQADMDWSDAEWANAVRRGKVVLKGSSDDPNEMLYEPGTVAVSTMQAEAVAKNAATVAADPNVDTDEAEALKQAAGHVNADRTPLVETELHQEATGGVVKAGTQRSIGTSATTVSSGSRTVDGAAPGAAVVAKDAELAQKQKDANSGDSDDEDDDDEDDKSPSTPVKAAPAKVAPAKATSPKSTS